MKKFIIVVVILLAAVAVWYYYDVKNSISDEGLNIETIIINEDTTESIQKDLDSLDLGDLELELNQLDENLENL